MPNERSSSPAHRALWFVENRLSDELTLHGVAEDVGVSPHHLARAFGAATGRSLMNYARGRRLTEAVRRLVDGDASFCALGYALLGDDGEPLEFESLRGLADRVSVAMHEYAYNGWTFFLPLAAAGREPQIRTQSLLAQERTYLEGMRLPNMAFLPSSLDYWRIYDVGIAAIAQSYWEDIARLRDGAGRSLRVHAILWRIHSLLAQAVGRFPTVWHSMGRRSSPYHLAGNRNAAHPVNAMLNYAYPALESEIRIKTISEGYDPTIGIMHEGSDGSSKFIFDLMEPKRPQVDRAVLEFVKGYVFDPADFVIRSDGVCRLNPEMARMVVARVAT
jgi:AraC-like DNA-binding protein